MSVKTQLRFLDELQITRFARQSGYLKMDRLAEASRKGIDIMDRHGHPPLVVLRPMRAGHFGIIRFIARFDRSSAEETEAVTRQNEELGRMVLDHDHVPYKCPATLHDEVLRRMDPGFRDLMLRVKRAVDPKGILSPDRWRLADLGSDPNLHS